MRLGTQNVGCLSESGVVLGVSLGYDHCAEHEWGYRWASRYLGLPTAATREISGVAARTTTKVDPEFTIELVEIGDALWLRGAPAYRTQHSPPLTEQVQDRKGSHSINELAYWARERDMAAAWDTDHGFCVVGRTDEAKAAIRVAHEALIGGRCFIIQSGGLFGRGGLKLIDAALIPAEVDADLKARDTASLNLDAAVEATGIRERLKAADRRYYALSPRWVDEAKGEFQFWLNPYDQQANKSGWFTLADLDAWIEGKGPIPKRAA